MKNTLPYWVFGISIVILLLSFLFSFSLGLILGAVFFFTSFDTLGYNNVYSKVTDTAYVKESLVSYRFMQTGFQILLTAFLLIKCPLSAVLFTVAWWFGVCDYLYYVILKQYFSGYGNMFWLWWSFGAMILGKENIYPKQLITFTWVGSIIVLVIWAIFQFFVPSTSILSFLMKSII